MSEVLGKWGASRHQVRLVRRDGRLIVEWYQDRLRREKSWPDAKGNVGVARAWAKQWAEERTTIGKPEARKVTLRELWELYQTASWSSLSDNTQRLYADDWKRWELWAGRHTIAEDVTPEMLHRYRRHLEVEKKLGVNSIAQAVKTCKLVYNWGEREEILTRNRWRLYKYKVAKKDKPQSPAEYTQDETTRLIGALGARNWRGWVTLTILSQQGVRQVSALQLKWKNIDLKRRVIVWPAETDKNGRELVQPLRKATVRALRAARNAARHMKVTSPYVLWSAKKPGEHYTAQSLWAALRGAEKRAGVEHKRMRAAHGLRRKMVGDLAEATGDTLLALRLVGDRDPRMAEHYRKDRSDQAEEAFRSLDRVASPSQSGKLGKSGGGDGQRNNKRLDGLATDD